MRSSVCLSRFAPRLALPSTAPVPLCIGCFPPSNVFAEQIEISEEQLDSFASIFGEEGHARDVQSIDGRTIVTEAAPVPLPLPAASLLRGLAALDVFGRSRRATVAV